MDTAEALVPATLTQFILKKSWLPGSLEIILEVLPSIYNIYVVCLITRMILHN